MRSLLRIGAIGALVGAVLQVAAGAGFGNLQPVSGTEALLQDLAALPSWYWPLVYLAFSLGAVLWVGSFVALAVSMQGRARAFGLLGLAAAIVGTAIHLVDSGINIGLAGLAADWAAGDAGQRAALLGVGDALRGVLHGTWSSVVAFYHGVPFVLFGMAMVSSARHPSWLGWVGLIGGVGSLAVGVAMFMGPDLYPAYVPFAVIVSFFMAVAGVLMWRMAGGASVDEELGERLAA